MRFHVHKNRAAGLSFVEILIALGILALLATALVPKVLVSDQASDSKTWSSGARGVAYMLMSAVEQYRAEHGEVPVGTSITDLEPYLNYIGRKTTGTADRVWNDPDSLVSSSCSGTSYHCYTMASGGVLVGFTNPKICDTYSPSSLVYDYDPDSVTAATTTGTGKSIRFFVLRDGSIKTYETMPSSVYYRVNATPGNACTHTSNSSTTNTPDWWLGFD